MSGAGVSSAPMVVSAHVAAGTRVDVDGFERSSRDTVRPFVSLSLGEDPARIVLILTDPDDIDRLRAGLAQARTRLLDLLHDETEAAEASADC